MGFGMEISIILAYAFGLVILYVIGYILLVPLKIILKLLLNGIIGGAALVLINWIGGFFDFMIPVNPITALVAGLLGLPGIVMLIFLEAVLL